VRFAEKRNKPIDKGTSEIYRETEQTQTVHTQTQEKGISVMVEVLLRKRPKNEQYNPKQYKHKRFVKHHFKEY
jgi:hypothetical protein